MPFKKGQSGNPGGRPKEVAEVRRLAQEHGPAAIDCLAKLMDSDSDRTRVAACEALLNRGYGRPPQSLTVAGDDDSPLFPDTVIVHVVKP